MQNFASRWSKQHNFRSSDRLTQLLIACKCMLCYSIMIFFFFKLHFLIFILKVSRRVLISGGSGTRKSSMDWTIARFRVSKHEFRIGQIIRTRPNLVSISTDWFRVGDQKSDFWVTPSDDILLSCSDVSKPGRCFWVHNGLQDVHTTEELKF